MSDWLLLILILVGLVVAWTVIKAVLKLTTRLFSIGCFVIALIAVAILIISYV
ncbi:MAG: hypothetical protein GTO18_03765 [Anaerolineales bacterium]|nr:hypothetical protein [Anaerolineales bacterium]